MLIGFAGERFSGKDTAAKYFKARYGFEHLKFAEKIKSTVEILFDLPDDWDWDTDKEIPCVQLHNYSKRQILQWYGTEGLPKELWTRFDLYRHLRPIIKILFDATDEMRLADAIKPYDIPEIVEAIARGGFRDNVDSQFWLKVIIPRNISQLKNWHRFYDFVISDTRFKNEVVNFIWQNQGYLIYINNSNATSVPTNHESESSLTWLSARADFHVNNHGTIDQFHSELESVYGTILRNKKFSDRNREKKFINSPKESVFRERPNIS